ncbi:ribonuclease P protein component [Flavihumibacter cheonanensis]|uniref:ribonuclease P protein component n=1 Tax=Flavihumibacter cheonanensis TaxID=1442385 RepID=UPI001EF97E71|nr:ribonuclease P protein component [Flavihumibacter cheonanensis]MCG7754667.1 ribonuclease P protein component [Flavihumibacter cheonanensis]
MQQKIHLYTLKARERLKHRKKIDALFTTGQKFSQGEIRVVFTTSPAEGRIRVLVGVGVSKRYFKKAVDRNLIKRRLREAIRLAKPAFETEIEQVGIHLDLFFLFTGKEIIGFDVCQELVTAAFKKLVRKMKP